MAARSACDVVAALARPSQAPSDVFLPAFIKKHQYLDISTRQMGFMSKQPRRRAQMSRWHPHVHAQTHNYRQPCLSQGHAKRHRRESPDPETKKWQPNTSCMSMYSAAYVGDQIFAHSLKVQVKITMDEFTMLRVNCGHSLCLCLANKLHCP